MKRNSFNRKDHASLTSALQRAGRGGGTDTRSTRLRLARRLAPWLPKKISAFFTRSLPPPGGKGLSSLFFCFVNRPAFGLCSKAAPKRRCETWSGLQESPREPAHLLPVKHVKNTENLDWGIRRVSLPYCNQTEIHGNPCLCLPSLRVLLMQLYHQRRPVSTHRVILPHGFQIGKSMIMTLSLSFWVVGGLWVFLFFTDREIICK